MPVLTLSLKVKPGARREAAAVFAAGVLTLSVRAPAVEGKANAAVVVALSELFDVPKSAIAIAAGAGARLKRVEIALRDETALARVRGVLDSLA